MGAIALTRPVVNMPNTPTRAVKRPPYGIRKSEADADQGIALLGRSPRGKKACRGKAVAGVSRESKGGKLGALNLVFEDNVQGVDDAGNVTTVDDTLVNSPMETAQA